MNIKIESTTKSNMKILGLDKFPFSLEELSANYRKLLISHHPDNGGSLEKTQQITSAYSALKNLAIHVTDETAAIIRKEKESDKDNIFEKAFWSKCSTCKGTGKVVYTIYNVKTNRDEYKVDKCIDCYGAGEIKDKPFNPIIPAGAVLV
jgi:DnaJ-class molecular chaperone